MKPILERLAGYSQDISTTLTRDRVTAHLEAGNSAETFADTLSPYQRSRVIKIRELLLDDQMPHITHSGRITFGMIRPHQELGSRPGPDSATANEILHKIQSRGRFRVALHLPWPVGQEAFTEFYGHVREKLERIPKNAPDGTASTVWDLFERYGITGASSFLILDAQALQLETGHQAWRLWRTFIGATNPKEALPGTLRKEYGSDYNNVVHGSDSPKSVNNDIKWMANQLK